MTEVNLIGFFHREDVARCAAKELKERGFHTVQVSNFSPMPGDNGSDLDNPISEPISSLASEVLEADISGRDASILAAARPDASGMADGEPHDKMENWVVTVVLPHNRHEEAKQLFTQYGARL